MLNVHNSPIFLASHGLAGLYIFLGDLGDRIMQCKEKNDDDDGAVFVVHGFLFLYRCSQLAPSCKSTCTALGCLAISACLLVHIYSYYTR